MNEAIKGESALDPQKTQKKRMMVFVTSTIIWLILLIIPAMPVRVDLGIFNPLSPDQKYFTIQLTPIWRIHDSQSGFVLYHNQPPRNSAFFFTDPKTNELIETNREISFPLMFLHLLPAVLLGIITCCLGRRKSGAEKPGWKE